MKVKTLLIFLLALSSGQLSAQLLIGPTIGGNYSWVKFGDKDYKKTLKSLPVAGYSAGVNVSFRVKKRFFLHTSFIYSTKGKLIEGRYDQNLRNRVINRFVEVPILYTVEFKSKLKGSREFKWYLGAGPTVSYWLGGKGSVFNGELAELNDPQQRPYRIAFGKKSTETTPNQMGVERPNRVMLGLNLSAGAVFEPMPHREFMLTLRYEIGHTYFSRTSNGEFSDLVAYEDIMQVQTRSVRLSLAYLIDLKTDQRKKGKSVSDKKKASVKVRKRR